jgi:hypothetical protein
MFGSYDGDWNDPALENCLANACASRISLRQQRDHPIAPPLRGSLDLHDVLAPSALHD